jgi:hypothetical protein
MLKPRQTMRWSFLGAVVCTTLLAMTGCYYYGGYMGASADFAYPYPYYSAGYPYGYYGAYSYPYNSYYSPYPLDSAVWYFPYGFGWWGSYYSYPYYGYPSYRYPHSRSPYYGGGGRSYRTR